MAQSDKQIYLVEFNKKGEYKLNNKNLSLVDVKNKILKKEMMALAFTTVPNNWRRVGHIITDKVYERLTGERGYFDTRIIYVAEEGPKTKRIKKLAIMDQDGANKG